MKENIINNGKQKYFFFGGKGGVGKTTMAASSAIHFANAGYKTLIVSTDPTVSLSAIFQQEISEIEPTEINGIQNLHALNINPKSAAGPFQKRLSNTVTQFTNLFGKETLNTPCMEEMAAFDQFVRFLNDDAHDIVVFDTAPTGHTLRELAMPFDWANFLTNQIKNRKELSSILGGTVDEGMLEDLKQEKARYDAALNTLKDERQTSFIVVLLAEKLPIEESSRAIENLGTLSINVSTMIVNEIIPYKVLQGNWFLKRRRETQDRYLTIIKERFNGLTLVQVPLFETDIVGIESLKNIGRTLYGN
ncbi:MAG: TRC40/GET3/ArsA family transport-energizing ATPase [Ignavibacteriales bacterium]|nr:TRC40/GET3/ArsA family transport-energizing ATPase [Ignavibacteriales bacterium]